MYRSEYPRPQMVRSEWINLNGLWEYRTDKGNSGTDRKWYLPETPFEERIEVPFCRESKLSGIGDLDFCVCAWYRKELSLPAHWDGKRILLHVGASNYLTTLWVDGKRVGKHRGGLVSFSFDLTPYLTNRNPVIILRVQNDVRTENQPAGKQSLSYGSHGCHYTRSTGIWQTVWLEAVAPSYIKSTKYYPDIQANTLTVDAVLENADGRTFTATASYKGRPMGSASATVSGRQAKLTLSLAELHLWEIGNGRLYDLELTLGEDHVKSYFGMRSIGCKDGTLILNGKRVFQRLVLDQGYYPDSQWTAPSEQDLIDDIERSIAAGFHGARLHQKVFEPVFLSHCDRLGYIVWGEDGNWGLNINRAEAWRAFLPSWLETVERDFNHPAIIGWCPLNETQKDQDPELVRFLANMTRAADPTRLYIEASGWRHVEGLTDMIDVHDYEQDPEKFAAKFEPLKRGEPVPIFLFPHWKMEEITFPTFVSEYGGIHWNFDDVEGNSWGYGKTPESREAFIARFKGLTEALLFHPKMSALCYTQLTDVEQEQNGLYTYDRRAKFDPAIFRAILSQKAAIEEE